ncbi:putative dehydrogenase [Novosphingobium hassiacum]|uniref:Putative dehydrogenase n=1 Tax=Novosphingobium hassiacum TaxID=173676 RepID=A0A7W6EXU6_9SPHN|nr:Gfo/Idh/MocA family oxidoreductase [Novosphingobium hassiacum]MBB3862651.1 putative dehydrogenase [Novosphingobium hassiacum]
MTVKNLKVGVVGASMDGGWARYAHMPALAAIPEIDVVGIATSRTESALRSAAAFNVRNGYGSIAELLASDVDLVAVSVRAPLHEQAAMEVVEAGKHLFVEWPMGANFAQSQRLVERARTRGVRGYVGLQGRASPAVQHAAALLADGYLGRLYSVSLFGAFNFWNDPVATAYSADASCGANILTIPAGHGLDQMRMLVGEVASVNARVSCLRESVMAADVGKMVPMTAPDQVAAIGTLQSGAVFSAHFAGTAPTGNTFRMMLVGDRGELLIEGNGMPEIAALSLAGTREKGTALQPITVPEPALSGLAPGPSYNTTLLWHEIARDLREGTSNAPTLESACETRRLLDAMERSAAQQGATITL